MFLRITPTSFDFHWNFSELSWQSILLPFKLQSSFAIFLEHELSVRAQISAFTQSLFEVLLEYTVDWILNKPSTESRIAYEYEYGS